MTKAPAKVCRWPVHTLNQSARSTTTLGARKAARLPCTHRTSSARWQALDVLAQAHPPRCAQSRHNHPPPRPPRTTNPRPQKAATYPVAPFARFPTGPPANREDMEVRGAAGRRLAVPGGGGGPPLLLPALPVVLVWEAACFPLRLLLPPPPPVPVIPLVRWCCSEASSESRKGSSSSSSQDDEERSMTAAGLLLPGRRIRGKVSWRQRQERKMSGNCETCHGAPGT